MYKQGRLPDLFSKVRITLEDNICAGRPYIEDRNEDTVRDIVFIGRFPGRFYEGIESGYGCQPFRFRKYVRTVLPKGGRRLRSQIKSNIFSFLTGRHLVDLF